MAESIALAVLKTPGYVVIAAILPSDVRVHTEASVSSLAGIPQSACRDLGDY